MLRHFTFFLLLMCPFLLASQPEWALSSGAKDKAPVQADAATVQRLIEQLNSPTFSEREASAKRLREIGEPALAALREAARGRKGLEARRRAEALLRAIQEDKLDLLVKQLESAKLSEREAAAKGLRQIGEPALAKLGDALRSNKRPELRRRAEEVIRLIQEDAFEQILKEATHQEVVKKDYKKAAEILTRIIDQGKERLVDRNAPPGEVPFLTEAYMRLARVRMKLGDSGGAANAYDRAVYYSNHNIAKRRQIEGECAKLLAGLIPGWEKAVREKIAKDPALKALAAKYPLVLLHSGRFAGGGYLQSAYSFIYETANAQKHGNDVQLLFDNGPGNRTFQVNMLTNQKNTVADLGKVDFNVDPLLKKDHPGGAGRQQALAVDGHVYLEKVEDTNGNRFFVLFKIVAVDDESRYMAFIWRRLPGGKIVRRR